MEQRQAVVVARRGPSRLGGVDDHEGARPVGGPPRGQACLAGADPSGLVAWMMALCMPSAGWWVKRTDALVKPAEVRRRMLVSVSVSTQIVVKDLLAARIVLGLLVDPPLE
jgi:hypothetical protein